MQTKWNSFEDQVRDVASRIYGKPCQPGRLSGVDLDGIIDISKDNKILVEITTRSDLAKVREDVNRLVLARNYLFATGIQSRSLCILHGDPTDAMREAGASVHVEVLSVNELAASFIEYERYRTTRMHSAFGSAIDPLTGNKDPIDYVPVSYLNRITNREYSAKDIGAKLLSGINVILLGEYGSGKSRCIGEIWDFLSRQWGSLFQFTFAINLRECWGLRSGEEIIRRHINSQGLDEMASAAVRVFNRRIGIYLLDGFDEIGTQSWSADEPRLRQLRSQALAGVKDIAQNSSLGTLVAGREHYFSSQSEMFSALGFSDDDTIVVYAKDEFTQDEISAYFEAANIDVSLPEWLPRRPLICQTIAQLEDHELERMFGAGSLEAVFWNFFIEVICKRDARINAAFDPNTIYRVFIELARKTRGKPADVGPINQRELQDAFEAVVGQLPVEEASVMLQRLPSLGRVGAESTDRQFIDTYILDGLRAKDVARLIEVTEDIRKVALEENWTNPLHVLGQKVLSYDMRGKEQSYRQLLKRAASGSNGTLAADLTSSIVRTGASSFNFEGLKLEGGMFSEFDFSLSRVTDLHISQSIFDVIVLPNSPPHHVSVENCLARRVAGASSMSGLPSWMRLENVDEFDSVQTVARIRHAGLSIHHEILVAVIKKTFFQKGGGRKEEALLRGFGSGPAQGVAPKILNLLLRENILGRFKGDEGWVYTPIRSQAGRMKSILDELRSSTDPLWQEVSGL